MFKRAAADRLSSAAARLAIRSFRARHSMWHDHQEIWFMHAYSRRRTDGVREPLCLAALSAQTGEVVDGWADSLPQIAPFPREALVVVFDAPSAFACFGAVGWRRPKYLIDLFAEFRNATNGQAVKCDFSDALAWFGLPDLSYGERCFLAALDRQHDPHTTEDREKMTALAANCAAVLPALFDRCLSNVKPRFARLRGSSLGRQQPLKRAVCRLIVLRSPC